MVGAPSQLDLFDYKPALNKWDGKDAPEEFYKGKTFAFITGVPKMMASPYKFLNTVKAVNGCQNFYLT